MAHEVHEALGDFAAMPDELHHVAAFHLRGQARGEGAPAEGREDDGIDEAAFGSVRYVYEFVSIAID